VDGGSGVIVLILGDLLSFRFLAGVVGRWGLLARQRRHQGSDWRGGRGGREVGGTSVASIPRRLLLVALTTTALVPVGVSSAAAQGTLDQQSFEPTGPIGQSWSTIGVAGSQQLAETFTAGRTGILTQVDLFLGRDSAQLPPPLTVDIETEPSGAVLASSTVPASSVPYVVQQGYPYPTWIPVALSNGPFVVAGEQYAIVLADSAAPSFGSDDFMFEGFALSNTYPGGNLLISSDSGATWNGPGAFDLAFRTYVEPEPTSMNQCMSGGWLDFPQFKNQGVCVSFVVTHGKNPPG
jgi:hypothetical protein